MNDLFKLRVKDLLIGAETEPGAAELLAQLNKKLRDIEKAQLAEAQKRKVVVPPGVTGRRNNMSAIWQQIEAARRKKS
jgi:hypothetical protein